jgi:hypothetical protein
MTNENVNEFACRSAAVDAMRNLSVFSVTEYQLCLIINLLLKMAAPFFFPNCPVVEQIAVNFEVRMS